MTFPKWHGNVPWIPVNAREHGYPWNAGLALYRATHHHRYPGGMLELLMFYDGAKCHITCLELHGEEYVLSQGIADKKKKDLEGIFSWFYLFIYLYTAFMLIQAFSPYTMMVGFVCVSVPWIVVLTCLDCLLTFLFLILDAHNNVLCMFLLFLFSNNFTFVWCHCFATGIWFSTL